MESWSTHRWVPPLGRIFEIKGQALRHFLCETCKRDFVEEMESGERYAVNVGTFDFKRLSDEVTDRWLRTPCGDHALLDDAEDRRQLYPAEPLASGMTIHGKAASKGEAAPFGSPGITSHPRVRSYRVVPAGEAISGGDGAHMG